MWIISLPAWGDRCVTHVVKSVFPALDVALRHAGIGRSDVLFLVHTDQIGRVTAVLKGYDSYYRPEFSGKSRYHQLTLCNREAISYAKSGDRVALINADTICSKEVFAAANERFNAGVKLIITSSIRTSASGRVPIGAEARQLLDWAWTNRHHWIEDCVWGRGKSTALSNIFFTSQYDRDVIQRAFHLQPFAFQRTAENVLNFDGLTVDDGLISKFKFKDIHVVTDPDEMSFAEMSPPGQMFKQHGPINAEAVVHWANAPVIGRRGYNADIPHLWLFKHRICLRGEPERVEADHAVCDSVLGLIKHRGEPVSREPKKTVAQ